MSIFAKISGLVAIFVLCFASLGIQNAHAAFLPNNLMDDAVFNNTGSMSAAQINSWLNANFPSSCISTNNGFSSPDPTGYSHATGYTYGGNVSGGRVVYDAALAYGLNPQVILATLQKESSVVSGTASYHCQYINTAMGYGCPDSGSCPTDPATMSGFSKQVIHAAWLLKFGQQRSLGNTGWDVQSNNFPQPGDHWDNSDDPPTCYGGPMTQGTLSRGCGQAAVYYDGYGTIDSTSVHMNTGATAALYWYTPHFSGNQNFDNIFISWFGYIYSNCFVPSTATNAFRLYNTHRKDYLYTTDSLEACIAESMLGYYADDSSFTITPAASGGTPLYRLVSPTNQHFYTASAAERDHAVSNVGYHYEGISFYVRTTPAAGYVPVYRLLGNTPGIHYYTSSSAERGYDISSLGYTSEGTVFYTAANNANNLPVFRLRSATGTHFYTISSAERDYSVNSLGFAYEGVAFWVKGAYNNQTVPIYRLVSYPLHMFTSTLSERSVLLQRGYSNEGVGFYAPPAFTPGTVPIYRLYRPLDGDHLLTTSVFERDQIVHNNGYVYEGVDFDGFN